MLIIEEKGQQTLLPAIQSEPNADIMEMFKCGMHLGYSVTSCNPKMSPYIFGLRNGVKIFDLEQTARALNKAKEFIRKLAQGKKTILFSGTKKEVRDVVEKSAKELNMPFVKERWIGGTLTNFKQIKARIDYLNDLKKKRDIGELDKYTKKEKLQIERNIAKMEVCFGGLADNFKGIPSAVVVVDSKHEKIAVNEAIQSGVPVVALLNSDCNPAVVSYPAPGNDNSLSSVSYFMAEIVKAYKEGIILAQQEAIEIAASEKEQIH